MGFLERKDVDVWALDGRVIALDDELYCKVQGAWEQIAVTQLYPTLDAVVITPEVIRPMAPGHEIQMMNQRCLHLTPQDELRWDRPADS